MLPAVPDPAYPIDAVQGMILDEYKMRLAHAASRGHPGAAAVLRSAYIQMANGVTITYEYTAGAGGGAGAGSAGGTGKVIADRALPEIEPPPGVHYTPTRRIGDQARDACLEHLGNMLASGHIGMDEYEARARVAVTAETKEQLDALVRDLPPVPREEEPPPSRKPVLVPAMMVMLMAAGIIATVAYPVLVGTYIALTVLWSLVLIQRLRKVTK